MAASLSRGGGDYHRPRRPNPDTIAYLRSLPLDLSIATEEITQFLSSGNEDDAAAAATSSLYPVSYAAALTAIQEIHNEIASLAGDEQAAEVLELLVRVAAPYSATAARSLLYSTAGYGLHLSTHRYGSHVLQTILELAATSRFTEDLALHEESPTDLDRDNLPSLRDLLLGLLDELLPHAVDLARHVCGSHVLRTLACCLGGVELRSADGSKRPRRGKIKPGKKRGRPDGGADGSDDYRRGGGSVVDARVMPCVSDARVSPSDPAMRDALKRLSEALTGREEAGPPGQLQQLACHASAGPLLAVLLRVLTYRDADGRDRWTRRLERWESNVARGPDRLLAALQPEPQFGTGSEAHLLAQRLLCWKPGSEEQPWTPDAIYGMAGEPRGSHCLETLLRICSDDMYASIVNLAKFTDSSVLRDYAEHEVSNYVVQTLLATVRSQEQAVGILEALQPCLVTGFVLDPVKKRRGILWRALEMACKYPRCQQRILEDIVTGFCALEDEKPHTKTTMKTYVPKLLSLKKPALDGERLGLDAAGTRALYYLLRFEPDVCREVVNGIVALSEEELVLLARDALGSRCILDGLLEGSVKNPVFSKALRMLLTKLRGRWVALSVDRVAHHTVKKLFWALQDMKDRLLLVRELISGKNRLSGSKIGRSVLDSLAIREYEMKGEKEWSKLVRKTLEKEDWLHDIAEGKKTENHDNKKRKATQSSESKSQKKKKRGTHSVTIDTILDSLPIPTDKLNG